jgi:hypothetical protein
MKSVKNKKKECEKYGIAVTNLVLGEDIGMPKEVLFDHLRKCKECREDLFEWRDTYIVMRLESEAKNPEHKKKIAEMVAGIKRDLLCSLENGKKLDKDKELGVAAGDLWHILAKEGPIRVADIPQKLNKYAIDQAFGAYGWLALQDKLEIIHSEIGKCVDLTKAEREQMPHANPV